MSHFQVYSSSPVIPLWQSLLGTKCESPSWVSLPRPLGVDSRGNGREEPCGRSRHDWRISELFMLTDLPTLSTFLLQVRRPEVKPLCFLILDSQVIQYYLSMVVLQTIVPLERLLVWPRNYARRVWWNYTSHTGLKDDWRFHNCYSFSGYLVVTTDMADDVGSVWLSYSV